MQVVQGCMELGNFYRHYRHVFWFMVYGRPFAIVMLDCDVGLHCEFTMCNFGSFFSTFFSCINVCIHACLKSKLHNQLYEGCIMS
jgi:hypothetical protein